MTSRSGWLCALASVCTVPPAIRTDWTWPWATLFAQYTRVASTVIPNGFDWAEASVVGLPPPVIATFRTLPSPVVQ